MTGKFKLQIILIAFLFLGINNLQAQEQGIFRINAGMGYGSKFGIEKDFSDSKGALGFNLGAEYLVGDKVGIAFGYSQFAKQSASLTEDGFTLDADVWFSAIDLDIRYYLLTDGPLVYGLLGYSSVKATVEVSFLGQSVKESESENAFNLGLGTIIPFSEKVGCLAQVKWQKLPDDDHFVANLGLVFKLN